MEAALGGDGVGGLSRRLRLLAADDTHRDELLSSCTGRRRYVEFG